MPLHTKPDANGKPRLPPRGAAMLYGVVRQARPAWAMYQAALVATAMLRAQTSLAMPPAEFGAMLDVVLAERTEHATERECKQASVRATSWEKNPYLKDEMTLLFQREMVRPALLEAEKWVADVTRIGNKAERAKDWGSALRAQDELVTHVPVAGLLSGKDVAGKGNEAPPPAIGQVNLNVIFANPDARRALEAVVRVLEGQPSGDGGQVVTGTVAQG